ncbi:UPF0149 family protein [Methylocystis sp. B8]|uniref:UPF0149 family protein n=1 Tax=Methylocystis sp. B8 TaxID=544938 RepID=UPI0010FDFC3D|nr:UPF0149 family protein [Methylocystis sp. B8]TLG72627.1 UPF0149 family protein [Methylocystis sp. B8]
MRKELRHLRQLENELLALGEEAMLLEELDGLVAGVLVCPEMIPPSEWLSVVWGQTADEAAPVFDTADHLNKVLTLVMAHYNDVAKKLFEKPESYAPYFAIDDRNGDVLWELWIEGFEKAVKLPPSRISTAARRQCRNRQSHVGPAYPRRCRTTRCALLQTRI